MDELINTNVFVPTAEGAQKFVDLKGLDYFWSRAKAYVDEADKEISDRVSALESTVGNDNSGLVKDVKAIQEDLAALTGGEGSIATQIKNAIDALDVEDTAVEGQYVSSVSEVDGKIVVNRANLPVYDEAGAAAQALADAKAYVNGIVGDTTGEDGTVIPGLDSRIAELEAIDHEKLASDASAAAVATILDSAPESFDTLKEVADWIANNDHADDVATLVTDVENLKKIDHEAYIAADTALETSIKGYVDGKIGTVAEDTTVVDMIAAAQAAAIEQAQKDAAEALKSYYTKTETDSAISEAVAAEAKLRSDADAAINAKIGTVAEDTTVVDMIAAAQAAAVAQAGTNTAEALKSYYTKTEVDGLLTANSTADKTYAKTYTDTLFASMTFASNDDIDNLLFPIPAQEA